MPLVDVWYRTTCPHCSRDNWIYGGDTEDGTYPEATHYHCWHCSRLNDLEEDVYAVSIEKGLPHPPCVQQKDS